MKRTCCILALGLLSGMFTTVWGQAATDRADASCQGGFVGGFSCNSVDLLAHLPVASFVVGEQFVATEANDVWGWADAATGREYALAGTRQGVVFVEVTNPESPVFLGALPTNSTNYPTWRDIKVYQDHAFVVADGAGKHGLQVFDLTQLRAVTEPTIFTETAHYSGIGSAHNIAINEETGFAYSLASSGGDQPCGLGLHIIDIRTPTDPQFAGCFNSSIHRSYTHDAQCVVYRGPDEEHQGKEVCIGADERGIAISDVTNKSRPIELSATTYPTAAYTHQGWLTDDQRYFYLNDEADENAFNLNTTTYIWDFTDLDAPELVAQHRANTSSTDHNLYIVGDYMYQANYGAGFRLLDISDRRKPVEIGFLDTAPSSEAGAWSVYPFFKSGTVLVSDITGGLFLVRPTMALRPAARDDYAEGSTNTQLRLDVLANDLDPNGEPLTVTLFEGPENGTVTINQDGMLTYRPNRNFAGQDVFTYTAHDPTGATDEARVTVQVNAPDASMARLQIIHDIADPAAENLDVYLDGALVEAGLSYQHGTGVLTLAGDRAHELTLTPAGSTPDVAFLTVPVMLNAAQNHVLVLQGLLNPDAFDRNPNGLDTGVQVALMPDARLQATEPAQVDLFVAQGVTDAGAVTVLVEGIGGPARALAIDLGYGMLGAYQSLGASVYRLELLVDGTSDRYELDLTDLAGEAVTLLISGFLDAAQQHQLHPIVVLADGSVAAEAVVVVDTEDATSLPQAFSLSAAYPNPFNPATTLDLTLPVATDVTVAVYDLLGRNVAVLHDGMLPAGTHALRFDAAALPSGTYFVRAVGARTQYLRPVSLVK